MLRSALASVLLGQCLLAQSILPPPPVPAGNPMTPAKVLLGKALFWDEQLSSTHSMACGTCHSPARGGTDARSPAAAVHPGADGQFGTADDVHGSRGVTQHDATGAPVAALAFGVQAQVTNRRAPSMINAAYATSLFLDGRAEGLFRDPETGAILLPTGGALESQIAGPPASPVEMGHIGRTWTDVANSLRDLAPLHLAANVPTALRQFVQGHTYATLFEQVYGSPGVTPVRIIYAIASYERSLISDRSPFDLWLAGLGALTPMQAQGLSVFQTHCASCHTDLDPSVLTTGPVLDDFRNIGVRPPVEDRGRQNHTGLFADRGKFRVPGMRNVALRDRFLHNGSLQTLGEVIDFYARGGDSADNRDPLVTALNGQLMPMDSLALQALMAALTDPRVAAELPPFDRPRLWSEGPLEAIVFGTGTGGTLALSPRGVAAGPAYVGNDGFGVGVDHLAPNLFAALLVDLTGSRAGIPVAGHNLYLGLTGALQVLPIGLSQLAPDGTGYASKVFHIPRSQTIAGTYWLQWIALDPLGPFSLVSSNALHVVVQ